MAMEEGSNAVCNHQLVNWALPSMTFNIESPCTVGVSSSPFEVGCCFGTTTDVWLRSPCHMMSENKLEGGSTVLKRLFKPKVLLFAQGPVPSVADYRFIILFASN